MQGRWCVPIPMAEDEVLKSNIDYACSRVDCSVIKYGGRCYEPNTLKNHASVAMNIFYQATGRLESSCDFNKTGLTVITDPSMYVYIYIYVHTLLYILFIIFII